MWRSTGKRNMIIKACRNRNSQLYDKDIKTNISRVLKEINCSCDNNKKLQNKDRWMCERVNYRSLGNEKCALWWGGEDQ